MLASRFLSAGSDYGKLDPKPMNFKQLMLRDGAPAALFLTPAARAEAWAGRPLTTVPLFAAAPKDESDETKAFRAQEDERRRLKSLEGIARMKLRMETKKIDFSKTRWDARRAKFVPLEGMPVAATPEPGFSQHQRAVQQTMNKIEADRRRIKNQVNRHTFVSTTTSMHVYDWSVVNKDTARHLAELNGVWDDKYAKLSGGLLVMTVTNRLKGLVKKGGEVKWN